MKLMGPKFTTCSLRGSVQNTQGTQDTQGSVSETCGGIKDTVGSELCVLLL